jgi:hypothetical protein
MSNVIAESASKMLNGINNQIDDRIRDILQMTGRTIEEFAADYEIQYHPVELVDHGDYRFSATQNVRFVKRGGTP